MRSRRRLKERIIALLSWLDGLSVCLAIAVDRICRKLIVLRHGRSHRLLIDLMRDGLSAGQAASVMGKELLLLGRRKRQVLQRLI